MSDDDYPVPENIEEYVWTEEFDRECIAAAQSRVLRVLGYSDPSGPDLSSHSVSASTATGTTSGGDLPEVTISEEEARFYYHGLGDTVGGNSRYGPRLILRCLTHSQ